MRRVRVDHVRRRFGTPILVKQRKGTYQCGQCVLAMILGCSISEAIRLTGGAYCETTIGELRSALRRKGIRVCAGKVLGKLATIADMPPVAIVEVEWADERGHWILKWGNALYDPSGWPSYCLGHFKMCYEVHLREGK